MDQSKRKEKTRQVSHVPSSELVLEVPGGRLCETGVTGITVSRERKAPLTLAAFLSVVCFSADAKFCKDVPIGFACLTFMVHPTGPGSPVRASAGCMLTSGLKSLGLGCCRLTQGLSKGRARGDCKWKSTACNFQWERYFVIWGHFALPKTHPSPGMGTLCTAKPTPVSRHGDTLHCQNTPARREMKCSMKMKKTSGEHVQIGSLALSLLGGISPLLVWAPASPTTTCGFPYGR